MENFNRAAAYYPEDLHLQEEAESPSQDFSAPNQPFSQENAKNEQKSGLNLENLMKIMKNLGSADFSTLASNVLKNQNPMMAQALSQLSNPKSKPAQKKMCSSDIFEEM